MKTESTGEKKEAEGSAEDRSTLLNGELGFPVRLLRKLEWFGLRTDHARLAKTAKEWWVSEEDQVAAPMPFTAIVRRLLEGAGSVTVMPVREEGEGRWRTLTYSPLWIRLGFVRGWTIGFWGVVAVLGWCVVVTVMPHQWQKAATIGFLGALAGWFLYRRFRCGRGAWAKLWILKWVPADAKQPRSADILSASTNLKSIQISPHNDYLDSL